MKIFLSILLCVFISFSCKKELNSETKWTYQLSKVKHSFLATNKELVLQHNRELNDFVTNANWFVTIPSVVNMGKAKSDWIQSFHQYNLIKPFLMFDIEGVNQIDIDFDRVELSGIDPSYIDYTAANPNSGIILDTIGYPNIFFQDIPTWDLHTTAGNESKITLGYHVIEFLLWGEDLSTSGAGLRTNNDYLAIGRINDRRRTFLRSLVSYLQIDNSFVNINTNYENEILEMESNKFALALFSSLSNFIDQDFASLTLYKPYISQDSKDELSPFSDNTKSDILSKLNAIKYFIDGRDVLSEHNDYFFSDFMEEVDSEKYTVIKNKLDECFAIYLTINGSFDNSIAGSSMERVKVYNLYLALNSLSSYLKEMQTIVLN